MKNYFKLKIRSVALICICFVISLSILQNTKMVQSAENTCTMIMDAAKNITATFATNLTNFLLTVTKAGTGSGTVTSAPTGINCGSDCTENYASGTSVTLTAAPASGSTFAGWTGDCADSPPIFTPPPGETLNFSEPKTITVEAETTKVYNITVGDNRNSIILDIYGLSPAVNATYTWTFPDGREYPTILGYPNNIVGSSVGGSLKLRSQNNGNQPNIPDQYIPLGIHTLIITAIDTSYITTFAR
jgi:hypothetical protein